MKKFVGLVEAILITLSIVSYQQIVFANTRKVGEISRVIAMLDKSNQGHEFRIGVWTYDAMFAASGLWYMQYDKNFNLIKDSLLKISATKIYNPFTMSLNKQKNKLLYVHSKYGDISIGRLYEMDLRDYSVRKIIDSTENVSSAVYLGSSDEEIVYYSLGNPTESVNAGYYKYNMVTGKKELVLSYYSELGKEETINGFDISPDGKTMLIPLVKNYTPPIILSFDLEKRKVIDTVWRFQERNRDLLWLRYNNDGTKVLYSNYGQRAFSLGPSDPAEVGIIDFRSNTKKTFSIKPETEKWNEWTAPCPNWSPDCKHIVYGMGMIANSGAVGSYRLYVKTNVDEGVSSVREQSTWKLAKMFLW